MHTFLTRFKKLPLLVSLAVIITATVGPGIAYATDVDFFSGNDILYFDPNFCAVAASGLATNGATPTPAGTIAAVGNDNAEKIFNFLTTTNFKGTGGKPMNAVQAAGVLGNFQQESAMNPAAIEPNGAGHGLAQWSFDRWTTLQNLAAQSNAQWSDLTLQLRMIDNELNGGEGDRLLTVLGGEFAGVTDPARASYVFQVSYERAGVPAQANRDSAALAYYAKFKDKVSTPGTTSSTASTTSTSPNNCPTNTAGSTASAGAFSGGNFIIYNQCDSPWGQMYVPSPDNTACQVACGPTSMAMIIRNMTGQSITPTDTINYVSQHNLWVNNPAQKQYGTSLATNVMIAQNWGMKASLIPGQMTDIKAVLDQGGLVMLAGQGPSPFLPSPINHDVVIRGISGSQFVVADPNGHSGNFDINTIIASAQATGLGAVAVYK